MNCQRRGEDLKAQIRVARCYLGIEQSPLKRWSIDQLVELNRELSRKVREAQAKKAASSEEWS